LPKDAKKPLVTLGKVAAEQQKNVPTKQGRTITNRAQMKKKERQSPEER